MFTKMFALIVFLGYPGPNGTEHIHTPPGIPLFEVEAECNQYMREAVDAFERELEGQGVVLRSAQCVDIIWKKDESPFVHNNNNNNRRK